MFDLTEIQVNYILEMPLRRLTKFSRIELEAERDDLNRTIAELDRLLGDAAARRDLVSAELAEVAAEHATPGGPCCSRARSPCAARPRPPLPWSSPTIPVRCCCRAPG